MVRYRSEERGAGPVPRFAQLLQVSFKRALKDFPEATREAAKKEMQQMLDKGVLRFVKPKDRGKIKSKPIKTFLFIKVKFKADGSFDKVKARLVANGPQQDPNSYTVDDCTSPTAAVVFVFIVIAIAAYEKRHIKFIDVTGAYLNAGIEDLDIYVIIDAELTSILLSLKPELVIFVFPDGTSLAKLDRALYGTHQASLRWYLLLIKRAEEDDFVRNPIDPCVLNKTVDGVQITMVIYVDDIMLTSTSMSLIDQTVAMLRKEFKEITVHDDDVNSYLGMTFTRLPDSMEVTMEGFIKNLFDDIPVTGTAATPAGNYLFDINPDLPPVSDAECARFRSIVMRLMYLAKRVRPDILLPVSFLSTRITRCTADDIKKLDRVLKYLNGTREMGIRLKFLPDFLHAFIDASYGVHADAKSHSGMFITLGRGPFLVSSSKQKINSKSSYEAELVALSDKGSAVIWIREFMLYQGANMGPAKIREDNQSTITSVMKGRGTSERVRHIKVHRFWLKDNVERGEVVFKHTPTQNMIADILTKPLQGELFIRLRRALLNWD